MYIAGGQGQTTPGDKILMSTETSCHFRHLLQVSKKGLWSLILFIFFFHDFIHAYSPRAGADNPLGTKFWSQQEHLVTSVICCKFQKNLFEVWFYTFFFMILHIYKSLWILIIYICFHDLIHVHNPGAGAYSPPGDKVLMSTETSCHFGHLLLVSNHKRQ